eukprot:jgi/Tetstr1/425804/TSEL_016183.t1
MDNTRLPDDLYESEGCGGGNAASSTTDTASLTALVRRMLLRLGELDSRTSSIQQPSPQKPIPTTPAGGLEGDEEEDDPPPGFPAKSPGHAAFIDPRDWIDYLPRAYAESMPHKHATRDEYRHLLCYGVFTAAVHAALTDAVATLRAKNATARDTADANDLLDSVIRTIATCMHAAEDRLTYLRRFKCKKALTGEERVTERLVYSRFFDTTAAERCSNGVDGLLNALDDKRLEVSLHQAAKAQAAAQFKGSGSGGSGGSGNIRIKERGQRAARARRTRGPRHKGEGGQKQGQRQDQGQASARQPCEEDYYPADRGAELTWQDIGASHQVLRWIQEGVRIPFKHNRSPSNFHNGISMQDATPAQLTFLEGELARFVESGAWELGTCRKWVSRLFLVPKPGVYQWRCIIDLRVLNSYCIAEADRDYFTVDVRGLYMLAGLSMGWSLSPYYFVTLTQVFITHLRKPEPEPPSSSTQPTRRKRYLRLTRWRGARILPYVDDFLLFSASMEQALHLRQRLASLLDALGLQRNPTKGFWEPCHFGMHLGMDIDSASGMFYAPTDKLNRLSRHATRLIGRATRNARAGASWWTSVPSQSNGKPIHRPVETAYLHTDSAGYGWGGVLNGRLEARGFWSSADERQHITWKELKACLVDSHGIHLRARYIRSAANIWADRLSRHLNSDDLQLDPLMFADMESRFGPHSIDRLASAVNTLLSRYNAAWLNPTCEAVDSLHLPDADWRRENNWCNAPWPLLPDLVQKLRQSGAAANVVAPRWEGKAWHQALTEMAVDGGAHGGAALSGLFRPGRRDRRGSDTLGVQTLELLSTAWAPATAASYDSCMKQYFRFCEEERRPAMAADPGTMARYVTWLGNMGTIKASSLQPYLSAVNNFFKDHGREPMALGDLMSRVRKGLAASQVTLNPELMRAPLPARVVLKALTLAKALRLELGPTWGTDPSTVVRVELFRASLVVVVLCLFFCRGGAGVECRTGDLTVDPDGGILLYHRDRKGQRGADASKKLLCQLPASAHADIAELLHYFDAARQVFAGGRVLAARWAISQREGQAKWTADTLTSWLQLGATTSAYVIGVTMQKIKCFGGWAMESSV